MFSPFKRIQLPPKEILDASINCQYPFPSPGLVIHICTSSNIILDIDMFIIEYFSDAVRWTFAKSVRIDDSQVDSIWESTRNKLYGSLATRNELDSKRGRGRKEGEREVEIENVPSGYFSDILSAQLVLVERDDDFMLLFWVCTHKYLLSKYIMNQTE